MIVLACHTHLMPALKHFVCSGKRLVGEQQSVCWSGGYGTHYGNNHSYPFSLSAKQAVQLRRTFALPVYLATTSVGCGCVQGLKLHDLQPA